MRRKYFLRRAGIFFMYMMIPTLIVVLAFSYLNSFSMEKELRSKGAQTAEAVKTNIDLAVSNVLMQTDSLMATTRMTLTLKRVLNWDSLSYGDAMNVSSLRSVLSSIINTHPYIESMYIYFDKGKRFLSSESGVSYLTVDAGERWLNRYGAMKEDGQITIFTDENQRGERTLSIVKRMMTQNGCIVLNINGQRLSDILSLLFSNQQEAIYLLSPAGEILLGITTPQKLPLLTALPQADFDGQWVLLEGEKWMLHSMFDESLQLRIFSATSYGEMQSSRGQLLRTIVIIMLVNMAVVMLLAYITTKRSFDQIEYMIDVFDNAERGLPVKRREDKAHDEYDVIMNNIIYLFLNNNYLRQELMEKQYQQENAELMSLQLQINPHFLFNTLQTVDMEVRKEPVNSLHASMMLGNVSAILKYALSDPQEVVTVEEEIAYLKRYIAVQKFRFGDGFIIYYEVDDEVREAKVFRLLLQPLVENSLLHGIRGLEEKGYIHVVLKKQGDSLACHVSDTGAGMTSEEIQRLYEKIHAKTSQSIGLTNLNRRLVLRYGEAGALVIQSEKGKGTTVSFVVPLIY